MSTVSSNPELVPGAMVTPAIRLSRLLGRGGMGSVWVADHLTLRTQVVVKFIAAEFAAKPEALRRFEREASLAAQAKSPHVVQIFDHGISQLGIPYIAMELLEGEDLAKRIARLGPVDAVVFAGWLSQACKGLGRAHAKGIVHRDIKPENVFLTENDGEILVKLLDFGIAKADTSTELLDATATGTVVGTAYYMSPEQALGERDIDWRADLWAFGVLTYLALCGVRPFAGESFGQLVLEVTSGRYTPLSKRQPRLGPGFDQWMGQALARDRERRFQSAREMAESFERLAAQLEPLPEPAELEATVADAQPRLLPALAASPAGPLGVSTMSPSVRSGGEPAPVAPVSVSRHRQLIVLAGVAAAAAAIVGTVLGQRASPPEPARASAPSQLPAQLPATASVSHTALAVPSAPPSSSAVPLSSSVTAPPAPSAAGPGAPPRSPAARTRAPATPTATTRANTTPASPATSTVVNNPLRMPIQ